MALARALLSSSPALRNDSEIHGWLRTSRLPPARRHARARRGAPHRSRRDTLFRSKRGSRHLDLDSLTPRKIQPCKRLPLGAVVGAVLTSRPASLEDGGEPGHRGSPGAVRPIRSILGCPAI